MDTLIADLKKYLYKKILDAKIECVESKDEGRKQDLCGKIDAYEDILDKLLKEES